MYIFNTTFSVEKNSKKEWEVWMRKTYLPTFKDLLPDVKHQLFELMTNIQEDSTNYSCQWQCNNPDELEILNKYSSILFSNLSKEMKEKCLHFSSILKPHNI